MPPPVAERGREIERSAESFLRGLEIAGVEGLAPARVVTARDRRH